MLRNSESSEFYQKKDKNYAKYDLTKKIIESQKNRFQKTIMLQMPLRIMPLKQSGDFQITKLRFSLTFLILHHIIRFMPNRKTLLNFLKISGETCYNRDNSGFKGVRTIYTADFSTGFWIGNNFNREIQAIVPENKRLLFWRTIDYCFISFFW